MMIMCVVFVSCILCVCWNELLALYTKCIIYLHECEPLFIFLCSFLLFTFITYLLLFDDILLFFSSII